MQKCKTACNTTLSFKRIFSASMASPVTDATAAIDQAGITTASAYTKYDACIAPRTTNDAGDCAADFGC